MLTAKSMLLHNFAAWPMPTSPQWTIVDPMDFKRGLASSKFSFEPPTMNVSVPSLAAFTPNRNNSYKCINTRDSLTVLPPDTGPSIKLTPDFSASFAKVWETNGSIVLLSISRVSLFAELKARKKKQEEARAFTPRTTIRSNDKFRECSTWQGGGLLTLIDHF